MQYEEFLSKKQLRRERKGFKATYLLDVMFDFQKHLVEWSVGMGRCAIFAGCGLGKSLMSLAWGENVLRHVPKSRVLILTPLAVARQFEQEANKFGMSCKQSRKGELGKGIHVTNYERLGYFNPKDFSAVVVDECFAPGTMVETLRLDNSLALTKIEDICPGDRIVNASGVDCVKACAKRRINRVVVLRVRGKEITCSENHLFFTVHGWRFAKDIQTGDRLVETKTAVCLVRGDHISQVFSPEVAEVLQSVLLGEMENEYTRTQGQSSQQGSKEENRGVITQGIHESGTMVGREQEENCKIETYGGSQMCGKDEENKSQEWHSSCMAWEERGEWNGANGTRENVYGCFGERMDSGDRYNGKEAGLSTSLQSGLWQREDEDSYRSRRSFSQGGEERTGRQEGQTSGIARVDSVEVLESSDSRMDKIRSSDGSLYFYDLEATQHPSYSVQGLLVHNSSCIKSFDSSRRKEITEFISKVQYKLLCTATPAPNDFMELGSSSEALGNMSRNQMLGMFFTNDGESTQQWRLKGHAKKRFWQWVATWARAVRTPSDLGFSDDGFILPKLNNLYHVVPSKRKTRGFSPYMARTLHEQRAERKETLQERCELVASLVPKGRPAIVWCHLNPEGDLLTKLIPDAVQVAGANTDKEKEDRLMGFADGKIRILVTKPRIGGFGLNLQVCSDVFYFPSHSHEQYYQAIRRCWRFGQKREVNSHVVSSMGERLVVENMIRKERQSDDMYSGIVREINSAVRKEVNNNKIIMTVPAWL